MNSSKRKEMAKVAFAAACGARVRKEKKSMQVYSDESRETDDHALPDVEVFYWDKADAADYNDISMIVNDDYKYTAGWYWWSCFPGCMPDSDPIGPFPTEEDAINDARGND